MDFYGAGRASTQPPTPSHHTEAAPADGPRQAPSPMVQDRLDLMANPAVSRVQGRPPARSQVLLPPAASPSLGRQSSVLFMDHVARELRQLKVLMLVENAERLAKWDMQYKQKLQVLETGFRHAALPNRSSPGPQHRPDRVSRRFISDLNVILQAHLDHAEALLSQEVLGGTRGLSFIKFDPPPSMSQGPWQVRVTLTGHSTCLPTNHELLKDIVIAAPLPHILEQVSEFYGALAGLADGRIESLGQTADQRQLTQVARAWRAYSMELATRSQEAEQPREASEQTVGETPQAGPAGAPLPRS